MSPSGNITHLRRLILLKTTLFFEATVLRILNGIFFLHRPPEDGDFYVYTHYTGPPLREPSFFDSHHRVLSQDGIENIQLIGWEHPDIEDAESSDADYYDDGEVDMTDTDDLSETDDELMDFYANLLEKSDGRRDICYGYFLLLTGISMSKDMFFIEGN
ncbi:hypothetical protein H0G86_011007 [Trichoderma simmonsii]|uniref:Uncharacterized protein n=1 Tax=Trichoderma simmonsii TaxID=1491479 RepID=A0A8G0PPJ0_9HYPO|nr:hypothetical protein H0G86_011007 [Trichoderma simmonsii]